MFNKIKRFFYNLLYSLPFGMKVGDELLNSQSNSDDVGIVETVRQNRLSEDLKNVQVTQQVEEMRYRDYKVYRESNKYTYLGDGIAIKKEIRDLGGKIKLEQNNKFITNNILEELNRVDKKEYAKESYTLNIIYKELVKFKLEKYCVKFDFESENGAFDKVGILTLYFENNPNANDSNSYHFVEMMKNMDFKRSEYFDNFSIISFITNKASGEFDYVSYNLFEFFDGNLIEDNGYFKLILFFKTFERIDLTDKFYSESMEKKYQNKEKKENNFTLGEVTRISYCSECKKEINNHDADITKETIGKPLCIDCLTKYIKENENRD